MESINRVTSCSECNNEIGDIDELIEEYNNNKLLMKELENKIQQCDYEIEENELEMSILKNQIESNNEKIKKIHQGLKEILENLREIKDK